VGKRETVEAGWAHIRADQNSLSSAIIVAPFRFAVVVYRDFKPRIQALRALGKT
jgi:hypothetical protein